ncbi:STAS domain-containing protein [Oscillatoria sp. FACHB-1407]|uniref:STAS domain-containing protein n=1 Tax=Oscillatoria sp. FACHB-1407 TaxID=2692847 RepID=UPI001682709A|nr:STAS domain-containing protein [Oscillatoria sp. FACHB-1407]MBD2464293.1 STAS domain-containing protein [Oscillatoria sp. FACHB-1407]
MNVSSVLSDSDCATASTSVIVLQPCGNLDQTTSATFQHTLEQALRQSTKTVVVDLLQVTTMTTQGIEALQAALDVAIATGKELVIWAADSATYTALGQGQNRQQTQLSDYPEGETAPHRTEILHPGFCHFLHNRRQLTPTPSESVAKPFLKPVPSSPSLPADLYTVANWYTANPINDIA